MKDHSLESVLACANLPSLPGVAIEVLELTRSDTVQVSDIERVVQHDPALTAKILKTVNSSYYGLSQRVPTIGRALAYLGLNTVKSLVLGFSLVDLTKRSAGGLSYPDYWQRCTYCAAAARRIATMVGDCDADEAFIAALMQDIGMLAMDCALGPTYAAVMESVEEDHDQLASAEATALGYNHAKAGARLGEAWRLPEDLITPIRFHHDVFSPSAPPATIVKVVALSYQMYSVVRGAAGGSDLYLLTRVGNALLDLSDADLKAMLIATEDDALELSRLFEVKVGDTPDVRSILAEAEEAMVAHQLQMHREAEHLHEVNKQLSEAAHTDGLTGVANRKRCDEELAARFDQARAFRGALGLILIDADHFKSFNDTYGHQAGDAVLVELARRLEEGVADAGLVCRYGGEEFAAIVPGATRAGTAKLAEQLRESIASTPFDLRSLSGPAADVSVTASLGVAVVEPETIEVLATPEILLRAADKALYAAKDSGRNCVRVFRPRTSSNAA